MQVQHNEIQLPRSVQAQVARQVLQLLRQKGKLIRVISARDMHRKERAVYEQTQKDT